MYEVTVHGQPLENDYDNVIDQATASDFNRIRDKLIALYKKHGSTHQYRVRFITGVDITPSIAYVSGADTATEYANTGDPEVSLDKAFKDYAYNGLLRRDMATEIKDALRREFGVRIP